MQSPNAEDAIGRDDVETDWRLRPDEHARSLPAAAGALKRVLERPEIDRIMREYMENDAAAGIAQARYKRIGRLGLYAATAATLVGAIFLLPIERWLAPVRPFVSVIQVGALIAAYFASRWLMSTRPFDAWMKTRAKAENARAALFDEVMRAPGGDAREGEVALLPLKLEYFRRYHLDTQRRYYRGRGAQHKAAVWRNNKWLGASFWLTLASILLGVVAFVLVAQQSGLKLPAAVTSLLGEWDWVPLNRIILALGVVASGCYGLGVARSLMDLDERNASRFETTAANLEFLSGDGLAKARHDAALEHEREVLEFVDRVQQQISSEHREWVILSGSERDPDKLQYNTARA